jgi:hypothetical protein
MEDRLIILCESNGEFIKLSKSAEKGMNHFSDDKFKDKK